MYNSGFSMTATAIAAAFVLLVLIEGNPFPVLRRVLVSRVLALYITIMAGIIGIDVAELYLERFTHRLVTWDFTPLIYHLEGSLTAGLQRALESRTLTAAATFFYVFVFPVLVWVALAVFNRQGNRVMMKKLLMVFLLNYVIALPFYVLFPVSEAWHTKTGVNLLVTQVYPAFDTQYRSLSGLDNCFPSLHTSLSVSIALLAVHSGHKRLAWVTSASSMIIVFSTLYLGIHWLTDITAGMAAAVISVNSAIIYVDGWTPVAGRVRQAVSLALGRSKEP